MILKIEQLYSSSTNFCILVQLMTILEWRVQHLQHKKTKRLIFCFTLNFRWSSNGIGDDTSLKWINQLLLFNFFFLFLYHFAEACSLEQLIMYGPEVQLFSRPSISFVCLKQKSMSLWLWILLSMCYKM